MRHVMEYSAKTPLTMPSAVHLTVCISTRLSASRTLCSAQILLLSLLQRFIEYLISCIVQYQEINVKIFLLSNEATVAPHLCGMTERMTTSKGVIPLFISTNEINAGANSEPMLMRRNSRPTYEQNPELTTHQLCSLATTCRR